MATSIVPMSSVAPTIVNTTVLQYFPFNVYAGTTSGILKGCKLEKLTSHNISRVDPVTKSAEITCMSWWNNNESSILVGHRDGHVYNHSLESGTVLDVPVELCTGSSLKVIRSHEDIVATAFSNGVLKCYKFCQPEGGSLMMVKDEHYPLVDINAGSNLYCMDHNSALPNFYATGGKENPLKIWDVSKGSTDCPVFSAKNVKNDWLNLAVPVWETNAQFFPQSNKVVTGTGYCQIRLYDPSTPQRRPVIEIQPEFHRKKYPVSALTIRPSSDFQIVFGTTTGNLALADLRKKSIVRHFKGAAGGITDVKFHPKCPIFAACGLGGHLQCYDADIPQRLTHSVYMRSPLNCILFSSEWSLFDKGQTFNSRYNTNFSMLQEAEDQQVKKAEATNSDNSSGEDDEDVWKGMEVVQTKKRKTSATSSHKKSKKKRKVADCELQK